MKNVLVAVSQLDEYLDCGSGIALVERETPTRQEIKKIMDEYECDVVVYSPVVVYKKLPSGPSKALEGLDYSELPKARKRKKAAEKAK